MLIVYTENVHRSFSPKDVYSLKQSPTETGPIETNKTCLEVYPPPAVCNNSPSCLDVYDKHTGLKSAAGSPERPDHLIPGFLGTCVCFFIPLMALANVLGLKPFKVMHGTSSLLITLVSAAAKLSTLETAKIPK